MEVQDGAISRSHAKPLLLINSYIAQTWQTLGRGWAFYRIVNKPPKNGYVDSVTPSVWPLFSAKTKTKPLTKLYLLLLFCARFVEKHKVVKFRHNSP